MLQGIERSREPAVSWIKQPLGALSALILFYSWLHTHIIVDKISWFIRTYGMCDMILAR